jgi:hypothetical protein
MCRRRQRLTECLIFEKDTLLADGSIDAHARIPGMILSELSGSMGLRATNEPDLQLSMRRVSNEQ